MYQNVFRIQYLHIHIHKGKVRSKYPNNVTDTRSTHYVQSLSRRRYGRRPTIAIGSVVYAVVAVASSWLSSLTAILISRFLLGTLHAAILKAGYILGG